MRGRRVDLAGQVFGNLTVTATSYKSRDGHYRWLCVCSCGARTLKRQDRLMCGMVKSCSNEHRFNRNPSHYLQKTWGRRRAR